MLDIDKTLGVLWDLDGVIVDSGEAHYKSWQQALSRHGLSFSREFFQETFGMNNRGILSQLLKRDASDEEVNLIGGLKEEFFRQDVKGKLVPLPGVTTWLEQFSRAGFRQAVASSAPQLNIDAVIDSLGLRNSFQELVSGSELSGKPDPATFLLAARRLNISPANCLVIEDAFVGVEAARRGGMKCVAVCTTHPKEELSAADIVVNRLDQLIPQELEKLFPH